MSHSDSHARRLRGVLEAAKGLTSLQIMVELNLSTLGQERTALIDLVLP